MIPAKRTTVGLISMQESEEDKVLRIWRKKAESCHCSYLNILHPENFFLSSRLLQRNVNATVPTVCLEHEVQEYFL